MKRKIFSFCLSILTINAFAQSSSFDEKAKVYVQKYASWAIEEQQRVGIPAAITLAQGIYETGAGESELATQANNHFGIKCKKEWRGETFAHTDDAPNECFRKYKSAKESYIDHSNYLKNSLRYAELFTFDATNYTAWAKGLKKCGYATNPAYAQKLIKMVEDYELQQYTLSALRQNEVIPIKEEAKKESETPSNNKLISSNESSEGVDQTPSTKQDGIVLINNLKAVFCKNGEMLLEKAIANNIRYARLLEINELNDEPLQRDMFIFLEPKSSKGAHATYIVSEAETIEEIAQKEGMNSRQLRIYNLMAQNEQAVAGSVLKLQEQSDERPTTYKMQRANISKEIQTYKLKDAEQKSANSEFVPTKKNTQQVEEIEMGYGAERPAFLTKEASLNNKEEIKQVKVEEKIQAVETDKKLEEKKVVSDEPLDEIALLKARLDKAVYAKKASSNIKVSSSDTVNISAPNAIAKPKIINHPTNTSINEDVQYHVVEKGDTGYSIAKKFGIKIKQLNEWNNLNFDGIKIGQKLRVK